MVPLASPSVTAPPARVLVVEDDVLVRAVLADELREAGHVVVEASSAEEALMLVDVPASFQLVISDVHMAGPLTGLDLARSIRRRLPDLPIILTSGVALADAIDAEFVFIPKPYAVHRLIGLVGRTLAEAGDRDAPGDQPRDLV